MFEGGGALDHVGRLIVERRLEEGLTYEHVTTGDVYVYDGAVMRLKVKEPVEA